MKLAVAAMAACPVSGRSMGLACLLVAGLTLRAVADDPPEIAVEAGATEIFEGESVDYFVEIRNVENPSPPDLSAVREKFEVTPQGDESRNQSSTFIINGRVTQQSSFGHVYRYRLTPKQTGETTIPAPVATVDGKELTGRTLPLRVIVPEPQDLVVAEMTTDRAKVYPTQPFEVTLRVLVRPLPDDDRRDPLSALRQPPHLEVNLTEPPAGLAAEETRGWLERLLSDNRYGFTLNDITTRGASLFDGPRRAVFHLYVGRETRPGLDGRSISYFAYELKRTFTPERAGTFSFGPGLVKGTFADSSEDRGYTARRLVVVAAPLTVDVRDVPSPRPASFCGGIGTYRIAASANPTTLRVGDPLTLTLEIEREPGSGSLELIAAPDLATNAQLAESFDIIDRNPTGRTAGQVKRFAYALRPRRPGVGIPPLSMTLFDPDTEKFKEVATSPIPLQVTEAGRVEAGDLVGSLPGAGARDIRMSNEGIFQNVTDPSELADQRVNVAALAGVAAGLWCITGCLGIVVSRYRSKSCDAAWRRRQQARRAANGRLAEARAALTAGRPEEALRSVRAALVGLIADMRNIVTEGLTATEADAVLLAADVPADERSAVLRLLQSIESAEYGSGRGVEAAEIMATAADLLPGLARNLEAGS